MEKIVREGEYFLIFLGVLKELKSGKQQIAIAASKPPHM